MNESSVTRISQQGDHRTNIVSQAYLIAEINLWKKTNFRNFEAEILHLGGMIVSDVLGWDLGQLEKLLSGGESKRRF